MATVISIALAIVCFAVILIDLTAGNTQKMANHGRGLAHHGTLRRAACTLGLSPAEGLRAALKADTLSLTAWQLGMYGWMAIAVFGIFKRELPKTEPVFWFMMQIAMLAGFVTAFPMNWWLLKAGVKEKM